MAVFTKHMLTGSSNGKHINIASPFSPGSIIHQAPAGVTTMDEVWIYATNIGFQAVLLTIEWGDEAEVGADESSAIKINVEPYSGYKLVVPGLLLNNHLVVKAFASETNVIMINGFVNRITS